MLDAIGVGDSFKARQSEAYSRRDEIAEVFAAQLKTRTFSEWAEIFEARKIWFTQVNDYETLADDPQLQHNHDLIEVEAWTGEPVTLVANPVRYDGKPAAVRLAPQKLGAQTAEILTELGYGPEAQKQLADRGVVAIG